jgi:cytochrome c-type biogenesis protein CcsB
VSNLYESLLFLTLLFICFTISLQKINTFHFFLEKRDQKYITLFQKLLNSIISTIPVAFLGFASFCLPIELQKSTPLIPALKSNWLFIHASVILLAYAGLLIGSLISVVFLRTNKWNLFNKPWFTSFLEKLDEISYRFILFSYPFLSLGILSGAVWANETWGSYWNWDPKETWSLITWLIFAAYLHERLLKKKKGRKAASIARSGFRRIWITFLGVNLLGKGLHSYGWF